ncbi:Imm49 family immunity protein [Bibersteinia trehalosi]|uniref:Imm49 family immunity protein n=1 Tax=Bibersteinia trehalosi TaxID=47735 RepID=UPI003D26C291
MKNYTVYLGSSAGRNMEDSIKHVKSEADFLYGKGYWDTEDKKQLLDSLDRIKNARGNVPFCMETIGHYYIAQSSLDLLLHNNLIEFKKHSYIGGKLKLLGEYELPWAYTGINVNHFFSMIMSDSPDLINYLITHRAEICAIDKPYNRKDPRFFFNANTLLALSGDWDKLKPRALEFLDDPKKEKYSAKRYLYDQEFYVALCEKDTIGMETALKKLLEPKQAKRSAYDSNLWFDFYLQPQVLLYGKIAAIHGFDLDIDSPISPKELIEYKPLEKYEDPYDFMKEFDYNQPQQVWIEMWEKRMQEAKEREEKKKKWWLPWFLK